MKKFIIATALFISAGVCVSASLIPANPTPAVTAPVATTEPNTGTVMKDLATAD